MVPEEGAGIRLHIVREWALATSDGVSSDSHEIALVAEIEHQPPARFENPTNLRQGGVRFVEMMEQADHEPGVAGRCGKRQIVDAGFVIVDGISVGAGRNLPQIARRLDHVHCPVFPDVTAGQATEPRSNLHDSFAARQRMGDDGTFQFVQVSLSGPRPEAFVVLPFINFP